MLGGKYERRKKNGEAGSAGRFSDRLFVDYLYRFGRDDVARIGTAVLLQRQPDISVGGRAWRRKTRKYRPIQVFFYGGFALLVLGVLFDGGL